MRTLKFLIQKEFIQVFRNRTMLPIIFVVPIVQLLILVHAATFELRNIDLYVVDKDLSSTSRQLVSKFEGSRFFQIAGRSFSIQDAENALRTEQADVIFHIPAGFERDLLRNDHAGVQILINAINGTAAGIINAYATSIISGYNQNIVAEHKGVPKSMASALPLEINYSFWFNPDLNYKNYMVPGVLVLLVTIIGLFLSGMSLVREKEIGTIEQINVTPIKKHQFIIGKLLPFWIIALFELAFGLFIGKLIFDIPLVGSIFLIFGVASVYLLVILGIGLFISTVSESQQQAMFISFFFVMIFILMSGLFTPIESMPDWAKVMNKINPVAYFIKIIRMVLLKGSELAHILKDFIALGIYAAIILALATFRYRKTG